LSEEELTELSSFHTSPSATYGLSGPDLGGPKLLSVILNLKRLDRLILGFLTFFVAWTLPGSGEPMDPLSKKKEFKCIK
jgi:hypothetical protein